MLSKGHANTALGAVLAQAGFVDDGFIDTFYAYESKFGMHPDIKVPGVEMCTGALGHGLSVGLGMALGSRLRRKDWRTVVMLGDGELQEGSNWEAAMAAAHLAPLRLTAILDYNKVQQSGHVAEMLGLEPLADKWRAFGWSVRECDGHDMGGDRRHPRRAASGARQAHAAHRAYREGQGHELRRGHVPLAQPPGERRGLREGHGRAGRAGMNAPQQGNGAEPAWVKAAANQSRLAFGLAVTELGRRDERVVAVGADTLDLIGLRGFIAHAPARVIDVGIAEQNAMGVAAGLATTGLRPFVCGYAPFITARSMEQIRNEVAYADQRVVIGAAASGVSLAVSGRHAPCAGGPRADAEPAQHDGAGAGGRPRGVARDAGDGRDRRSRVHSARRARAGAPGDAGRCAVQPRQGHAACRGLGRRRDRLRRPGGAAVDAAKKLAAQGIGARVLNMSTIKPLDEDAILAAAKETRGIVTAEEHHLTGGLGGAVAELLAVRRPTPMRLVGMPDEFAVVGPTDRIRARYGMSAQHIVDACLELMG